MYNKEEENQGNEEEKEMEDAEENESKKENITLVKSQSTGITSSLIEKELLSLCIIISF